MDEIHCGCVMWNRHQSSYLCAQRCVLMHDACPSKVRITRRSRSASAAPSTGSSPSARRSRLRTYVNDFGATKIAGAYMVDIQPHEDPRSVCSPARFANANSPR